MEQSDTNITPSHVQHELNDHYSEMKTTAKAFKAFLEVELSELKIYTDSLSSLYKSAGDHIGLKKNLNRCREHENVQVKQLIDTSKNGVLKLIDTHCALLNEIRDKTLPAVNELYHELKSKKKVVMKQIADLSKERESFLKALKKENSADSNKQQADFERDEGKQLKKLLEECEQEDEQRSEELSIYIGELVATENANFGAVTVKVDASMQKIEKNKDVSPLEDVSPKKSDALTPSTNDGKKENLDRLKMEDNEEDDEFVTLPVGEEHVLGVLLEKRELEKEGIVTKKKLELTCAIKPEEDIFHYVESIFFDDLDECRRLATEFDLEQFPIQLAALVFNFTNLQEHETGEKNVDLQTFKMTVKNKLKITIKAMQTLQKYYGFTFKKHEDCINPALFNKIAVKIAEKCVQEQCRHLKQHPEDLAFHLSFIKHFFALVGINLFWQELLVPGRRLSAVSLPLEQQELIKEECQKLTAFFFVPESTPIPNICQEIATLAALPVFKEPIVIGYPLKYSYAEYLVPTLLDINKDIDDMFIDQWEEHFALLAEFAKQVLAIEISEFELMFLSYFYSEFLHNALLEKEPLLLKVLLKLNEFIDSTTDNLTAYYSEYSKKKRAEEYEELEPKISHKAMDKFEELLQKFWVYVPIELSETLIKYYYCLSLECTDRNENSFEHFMRIAGKNFASEIVDESLTIDASLTKINLYLEALSERSKSIFTKQIPAFARVLSPLMANTELQQLFMEEIPIIIIENNKYERTSFIDTMLEDILKVLSAITKNNQLLASKLQNDKNGAVLTIAIELAYFDDVSLCLSASSLASSMLASTRSSQNTEEELMESKVEDPSKKKITSPYYSVFAAATEPWFENLKREHSNLLESCMENETWEGFNCNSESNSPKEENNNAKELYTEGVTDFCSLLFRSIETLKQMLRLSPQNAFKIRTEAAIEEVLHDSIMHYINFLRESVRDLEILKEPNFIKYESGWFHKPKKLIEENEDYQTEEYKMFIKICYRLGNLNFIDQELEEYGVALFFDRSSKKVEEVRKIIALAVRELSQVIAKSIIEFFWKNEVSDALFYDIDEKKFAEESAEVFEKNYAHSCLNLLPPVDTYFSIIRYRIPSTYFNVFGEEIARYLSRDVLFAMLDLNKLKKKKLDHSRLSKFFILEANYLKHYLTNELPPSTEIDVAIAKHNFDLLEICTLYDSTTTNLVQQIEQFLKNGNEFLAHAAFRVMYCRPDSKKQNLYPKYKKQFLKNDSQTA